MTRNDDITPAGGGEQFLGRDRLLALQAVKLRAMLAEVLPANAFWRRKFADAGVRAEEIREVGDLRRLPFTTKAELTADQRAAPPYGTNLTYPLAQYVRVHQTSGTSSGEPLRWLDTAASWDWFLRCWGIIYDAVGLTPADRLFFAFSFGPFVGFWAAFEGAQRRGNFCMAGGGMSSAARLRAMLDNGITAVLCTPTYALHLVETAEREGIRLGTPDSTARNRPSPDPSLPGRGVLGRPSAVRMLIVAGEPGGSVPEVRSRIERGFGARVFDHTGMTEIGSLGVECVENPGGVHLLETECIAEVIEPASGTVLWGAGYDAAVSGATPDAGRGSPRSAATRHSTTSVVGSDRDGKLRTPDLESPPSGVEGELVLTNLGRWGSPLIRYRTGDMVRIETGRCACGRHFARMVGGILGRADDMLIIRGNNVYPSAFDSVIRSVPGVAEYRVTISEQAGLASVAVEIETAEEGSIARRDAGHDKRPDTAEHVAAAIGGHPNLAEQVAHAIRDRLSFSADVRLVPPGTLPRFEMKARRVVRSSRS